MAVAQTKRHTSYINIHERGGGGLGPVVDVVIISNLVVIIIVPFVTVLMFYPQSCRRRRRHDPLPASSRSLSLRHSSPFFLVQMVCSALKRIHRSTAVHLRHNLIPISLLFLDSLQEGSVFFFRKI